MKCYYKNDKLEGEYIKYLKSGIILEKYYYKNGKREEKLKIIKKNEIKSV
jgi:antitoxin component YwqK of YwqJK toxin-antitoxin module